MLPRASVGDRTTIEHTAQQPSASSRSHTPLSGRGARPRPPSTKPSHRNPRDLPTWIPGCGLQPLMSACPPKLRPHTRLHARTINDRTQNSHQLAAISHQPSTTQRNMHVSSHQSSDKKPKSAISASSYGPSTINQTMHSTKPWPRANVRGTVQSTTQHKTAPTSSHQPPTTRHSTQNASQQSPVISQQKQRAQYQPAAMSNQPATKRCIPQNVDPRHATLYTKHYQTLMMWKAYGPKATRASGMREATNTSTLRDGGTREAKLEKYKTTLCTHKRTHTSSSFAARKIPKRS